ncbi:hypothetical protein R6Q59_001848 [Mikania micrantha]
MLMTWNSGEGSGDRRFIYRLLTPETGMCEADYSLNSILQPVKPLSQLLARVELLFMQLECKYDRIKLILGSPIVVYITWLIKLTVWHEQ